MYSALFPGSHPVLSSIMCFTLLFSVVFSILALNFSGIAFLHSTLNFAGFFSIVSAGIPSFCRYSLFSMAQLSSSFLWRMVFRVLFCPWLIRLCMFSLFLFIIAIGSRNPVPIYRHSRGVDCGVFRILFKMLSNILFISSLFFLLFSILLHCRSLLVVCWWILFSTRLPFLWHRMLRCLLLRVSSGKLLLFFP